MLGDVKKLILTNAEKERINDFQQVEDDESTKLWRDKVMDLIQLRMCLACHCLL